jgi:hypothetical protein
MLKLFRERGAVPDSGPAPANKKTAGQRTGGTWNLVSCKRRGLQL